MYSMNNIKNREELVFADSENEKSDMRGELAGVFVFEWKYVSVWFWLVLLVGEVSISEPTSSTKQGVTVGKKIAEE